MGIVEVAGSDGTRCVQTGGCRAGAAGGAKGEACTGACSGEAAVGGCGVVGPWTGEGEGGVCVAALLFALR